MTLVFPKIANTGLPREESLPHRFTLDEYYRLSELGFLENRTEFIDGEILDMSSQKDLHTFSVTQATYWCHGSFPRDRFWVRVQSSLRTGNSSPEPDLVVLDFPATASDSYASSQNAVLIIEVSDSTLLADTTTKMHLYASAGVKDYWVISIPDREIIVHRQPIPSKTAKFGATYADIRRVGCGQTIAPLAVPMASIDPATVLG